MGAHGARVVCVMILKDLLHDPDMSCVNRYSQVFQHDHNLFQTTLITPYQVFLDFVPKQVEFQQSQCGTFIFLQNVRVDKELHSL